MPAPPHNRYRRWNPIDEAKELLGVDNNPTQQEIERAFRVAAKRYHPDSPMGQKNPERFRECLEARNLLLDHCVRRGRTALRTPGDFHARPHYDASSFSAYRYVQKLHRDTSRPVFAKGFPFRTLHLLTTKSKLQIKAATMALVLALGLYDGCTRKPPTMAPESTTASESTR